jgi:hypothetical protein
VNKVPVKWFPWIVIAAAVLVCAIWTCFLDAQNVVVSDEEYEERCLNPDFSPSDPECIDLRPRSAPIDCSMPDFSPMHPFCDDEQTDRDADAKCGTDFSPLPAECY